MSTDDHIGIALAAALREVMGSSMGEKEWNADSLIEAIAGRGLTVDAGVRTAAKRVHRAYGGKFDDIPNARIALYQAVLEASSSDVQ